MNNRECQERWRVMYYPNVNQTTRIKSRVMTVIGNGSLAVEPNIVQIQLEVRTENKQLSQAQKENADAMNQVIESLLKLGIDRENMQTVSYTIFPQNDYIEGKQVFRGYEVRNAIMVKIRNIQEAGNVIDTAVKNGATGVSNIQFTVENEQLEYQKALSLALNNALSKAQTMAATMQLQLNPHPIKITEELNAQPIAYQSFSTMEKSMSTPIEQGKITINATVNVQFEY